MSKGALHMSAEQARAHQERHGFAVKPSKAPELVKPPKPRQNKTEAEYGLILGAMKRRGEILDYRPFGIKLEWGADPETGKPMVYSPDFTVRPRPTFEDSERLFIQLPLTFIEIKGGFIRPQDLIRFKGCRSAWPMFRFEMVQKAKGEWKRIL